MKSITIFYKNLIEPGGAERLLVKICENFTQLGYKVVIVSYKVNPSALFNVTINRSCLVEFGSRWWPINFFKLCWYLRKNKGSIMLCDSGHIDFFLASLLTKTTYSLHLHHPLFMSFNDRDKYSIFLNKFFHKRSASNFGAQRFFNIYKKLNLIDKLKINTRALLSILAIQRSKNNFVLSRYAQEEKKELFGINSTILCGALDEDAFNYVPKTVEGYEKYKHKILTIARLDENKRIDVLIKTFSKFLKTYPSSILIIGGRGPELENLRELAKALEINRNIEFLGFVPDEKIWDYYAAADLFVSIDWADYRITAYEALVMGTKVLLSNETEADEELKKAGYMFLTTPTENELLKTMSLALNTAPRITKTNLLNYLQKYSWRNYSQQLLNILDKPC